MTSFGEKSRKFARTWNGSGQSRDAIPVLQQSTGAANWRVITLPSVAAALGLFWWSLCFRNKSPVANLKTGASRRLRRA